jgi:hypothetical protein
MVFGAYYLTPVVRTEGQPRVFRHVREDRGAASRGRRSTCAPRIIVRPWPSSRRWTSVSPAVRQMSSVGAAVTRDDAWVASLFNEALPHGYPLRQQRWWARTRCRSEPSSRIWPKRLIPGTWPASLDAHQGPRFPLRRPSPVLTIAIADVARRRRTGRDLGQLREASRQGRGSSTSAASSSTRSAISGDRDLDVGQQRGRTTPSTRQCHARERQPDPHDALTPVPVVTSPADPPDRRPCKAWCPTRSGEMHPASDQVLLPRGPVGARVLHLDPRRP